jgi:hypothetical protein
MREMRKTIIVATLAVVLLDLAARAPWREPAAPASCNMLTAD